MAFCLPFSTALTLFFSAFGLLFGLLGFDSASFKQAMRHPISILCVALFAWLALSMLWSIAPPDELMEGISKYRKLLYVPLVAMLLISTRVKPWFLMNFFVVGCLVVCVGSLSSSSGLLEYLIGPQLPGGGWGLGGTSARHWFFIGPPEAPTFGRAWVAQGAFLAISSVYMVSVALHFLSSARIGDSRLGLSALLSGAALLAFVVLDLGGRSGYLLLALGYGMLLIALVRKAAYAHALNLVLGICLIFASHLISKPTIPSRVMEAVSDVHRYRQTGAETSQGLRLRFWESALYMAQSRPVFGWGVGSNAEVFARDDRQPTDLKVTRVQPHSEYILQLVQGGMVGLAALLILGFFTVRAALARSSTFCQVRIDMETGLIFASLLLLIDGFANSVIWDLAEGHLFALAFGSLSVLQTENHTKIIEH
jgi:O-antigen ligase